MERVCVLGAGSWGTTVAALAGRRGPTALWCRRPELAAALAANRRNPDYVPDLVLPEGVRVTASLAEAVQGASLVVLAVPSHGFRQVVREARAWLPPGVPVVSLAKGLERSSHRRMTEVLAEELPQCPRGVLSGPNLAHEIAAGQPAATVVAMTDPSAALLAQRLLHTDRLRIYTNDDVVGCEVAGVTKNVLALAAGMAVGLGLGDSSLAALVTRGLAELGRLVVALGGERLTVTSLAGVGDLVATCTSPHSRNRSAGVALGQGRPLAEILGGSRMVVEGVVSARPLVELAAHHGVELPIGQQVLDVLEGRATVVEAVDRLMSRTAKAEFWDLGEPVSAEGPVREGPVREGPGR
ncbi:NAD(P)H-dependent glycerol-3-phosphate dehydrogenase [Aciditerrimonas ferrireducens]|uniref:NAD(P)H-dependent glycerol-3-phosphate dehydrogenase n=1 Tax=Aciditerrimonas ferrireducens TaxID=667306 RepID=UPI002003EC70|nr:NAD(P)H-dependent glycerol-3-phosphate dehydrogenase [Aciditerrimonas ferrireducens]MCK4177882.1 NAD(P)-dependent glycerol-3-phosphate dehydrogenase [Aciditerrimonas ferrireducens]